MLYLSIPFFYCNRINSFVIVLVSLLFLPFITSRFLFMFMFHFHFHFHFNYHFFLLFTFDYFSYVLFWSRSPDSLLIFLYFNLF